MHLRRLKVIFLFGLSLLLASCTTPYQPPMVVKESAEFPGLVKLLNESNGQPVDVVLVHGMCTPKAEWPIAVMDNISSAVGANVSISSADTEIATAKPNEIQVVRGEAQTAAGTIRFTGLVWSPLVKELKCQLLYDMTGEETNCKTSDDCRPRRAMLNGKFKDGLLNDCLADALAYQGVGRIAFRAAMVKSLTQVVQQKSDSKGPIVVVSASLGSKMVFDALSDMLQPPEDNAQMMLAADAIQKRLAVVFMMANQLPILGLADQNLVPKTSTLTADNIGGDSLERFLKARRQHILRTAHITDGTFTKLALVAFTDPNDLLSYRLLPSRYKAADVDVADILVSNQPTYFGLVENPLSAHNTYLKNKGVLRFIACGSPESSLCK